MPSRYLTPLVWTFLFVSLVVSTSVDAGENMIIESRKASTPLDFSIIIPVVLRIIENRHPRSLPVAAAHASTRSATQHLVLVSTLGKGFCMELQLTKANIVDWQVTVAGSPGTWVQPSREGYRVCARHAGRYELALQHNFQLKTSDHEKGSSDLDWPVSLSLATP
jgi:hypothetical protein